MDQSTETIVITDPKGMIIYVNPAFEKTTGYSRKEAIGKNPKILQSGEHDDLFYHSLWQTISSGKTWSGRFVNRKKDGSRYTEEATISPVFSDEGKIVNYVAVKRDISESLKLEAMLHQSKKMEAIGLLAGGVAHDLNNVLSGIVSYPDLLLMDLPEDSRLRKPILTIQKSGQKAADIVQDLLTLARTGVSNREVLNLNDIILDFIKSPEYQKILSYHSNISVETIFDRKLMEIEGVTTQVRKMLMNLVSNAAEAQPSGGKIIISTKNQYIDMPIRGYEEIDEGEFVVLEVKDSGLGIAAEDLTRIFEPFYTKKVMGRSGTGLGMAVVWGAIHDHNGYINVESTQGIGTTFSLFFPATRKNKQKKAELIPFEEYVGRKETILVIDDIREQREIATNILEKLNYSVSAVSCGEDAVKFMEKNSVDLLVLDMIMNPGMDGLDTYKKIIVLHPKQKVIITSGYSATGRVKEAQKLGAGEYIQKPYTLEKIGIAVKKELNQ
jgi:PAS domain S-box-containing protein